MEKIVKILRQINIVDYIFAILFGVMCIFSRHVIDIPSAKSTILTTYVTSFGLLDLPLFIIMTVVGLIIVQLCRYIINWLLPKKDLFIIPASTCERGRITILWIAIFTLTMIAWIPYLMSYWPGGIYNDTLDSIHIALGKAPMDNQNTILYALWWRLIFWLGTPINQGDYGGLKLMTIVQPAIMATIAASFFVWLRSRGARLWIVITLALVFAFVPIFPFYAVSLWKDTLFGMNMFLLIWILYWIVSDMDRQRKVSKRLLIAYLIVSLLISFGRNNGIYIVIVTGIALSLYVWKKLDKDNLIMTSALSAFVIAISIIVQGPVFNSLGIIQSDPVEKYGIPLRQVAYMLSSGANISSEEMDILEEIMPSEGWINLYDPIVADQIKFAPLFDASYFNTHTKEFLHAYLGMVLKNPFIAFKGYALSTIGFWDAFKTSSSAYICTAHCGHAEYFMSDYFAYMTGRVLSDFVGPRWYISSGLLVWLMLLSLCLICGQSMHKKYIIPIIPILVLWGTLLIATPVSFSFRYVFSILLSLPLVVMCSFSAADNSR